MSERSTALRFGLGVFWIFAGTMHFVVPRTYEAIMPTYLERWKSECVAASGAAEIAGGLAVLPDRTRRFGRWWLLATLCGHLPGQRAHGRQRRGLSEDPRGGAVGPPALPGRLRLVHLARHALGRDEAPAEEGVRPWTQNLSYW